MIPNPLILFDGVCNLCNSTVNFLIKKDKKRQFRFVALQTEAGQALLHKFPVPEKSDSVILITNGMVYTESEAALKIAGMLPFPWKLAGIIKILPISRRNGIYRLISRNRYKWFGKRNECRILKKEERQLFPRTEELGI